MSANIGETKFLSPINSTNNSQPLFAEATGSALFFNYSQNASGSLTSVEVDVLVNGGVASAISNANATFIQDPTFTEFFVENTAIGEGGAFEVNIQTETKVVANFDITAGETFSFDFTADLDLITKEIENPDTEYSKANLKTTFAIVDISNGVENAKLIDFFGFKGNLISSQGIGTLKSGSSGNVTFTSFGDTDIDGDNGTDYVNGFGTGNYERSFNSDTQLAVIEINTSVVELLGDTLINNLGNDVTYGTIWDDHLEGTHYQDKIYGSLGDDTIQGYDGDDIIEGGAGNDWLYGGYGRDSIHGGSGDDYIDGGYGLDYVDGGDGYDTVSYANRSSNFSLDLGTGVLEFIHTGNKEKIFNIEKVIASRGDDQIYGNQESNHLEGNDGDDYIEGGAGDDSLYGGYGRDTIYGGSGDDFIDGGFGLDYIDGGDGYDTVSYANRLNNFSLDLGTGVLEFIHTGNKEKILNIEKVIASRGDDDIYGNQQSNHLEGNDGDDYIKGVGGNNVLIGGDGFDTLIGGSGQDKINGSDSYNAGLYERDYLKGGAGADEFVLGDDYGAYYSAAYNHDYARIEDFTIGEDKLTLYGSASDYSVDIYHGDAYIFYMDIGANDKIAILDNVNSSFDLGSNANFV